MTERLCGTSWPSSCPLHDEKLHMQRVTAGGTAQVGKVGRASQYRFMPGVRELLGSGELRRDAEQDSECTSRWKMAGVPWPAL